MITRRSDMDTTVKLWDYLYKVRLPYLQSRSINDLQKFGTTVTGVSALDDDIQNQWITTMLSVAQMVELFKEGIPIKVVSTKDVKEIYDSISHHIHAWTNMLTHGINIGNAPIDDLITLDEFANTIYEHAKYQFTAETVNSLMAQQMNTIQRVNAHNFFSSNIMRNLNNPDREEGITRINAPIDKEQIPDRESMADFFKDRLITLRRHY